jgi:hypothetical protein
LHPPLATFWRIFPVDLAVQSELVKKTRDPEDVVMTKVVVVGSTFFGRALALAIEEMRPKLEKAMRDAVYQSLNQAPRGPTKRQARGKGGHKAQRVKMRVG